MPTQLALARPWPSVVGLLARLAVGFVALGTALAGPAAAQYGGGGGTMTFFVSPVRVPIDQTFLGFGTGCADGESVDITIDGVPGVLASTTAGAPSGSFTVTNVALPTGLQAGDNHDVRATCQSGDSLAFTITLVCPSGDDPVAGSCEDGSDGVVGGVPPTTTTAPGSGSGSGGSSPGTGGGGGADDSPPLAFTGAAFTGVLLQGAVTLVGLGGLIVLAARRRVSDDASAV